MTGHEEHETTLALLRGMNAFLAEEVAISEACDDAACDWEYIKTHPVSVERRDEIVASYVILRVFYPERFEEEACRYPGSRREKGNPQT